VNPMQVDLAPSGRGATARVEISNQGSAPFPFEVLMFRGEISETGELALTPADDEFLVFPPQGSLGPDRQQVVRVQYLGEATLVQSQIYYMSVRQVPVAIDAGPSRIQVVSRFNVLVNIVPAGARAEPVVISAEAARQGEQHGISVRIRNEGNNYVAASNLQWLVRGTASDGSAVQLRFVPAEANLSIGAGIVGPGRARVFFIPTDQVLTSVGVTLASGG
jgi:fimbrial chaperone protein